MRHKIVAGNWKMNKTLEEGQGLVNEIRGMYKAEVMNDAKVIVCPPYIALSAIAKQCEGSVIGVGAQNMHQETSGAYTGEISADMLLSVGCTYVIIGHSERRTYFHEDNALLAAKVNQALAKGLRVIYCCGETLEERNAGKHFDVNASQIKEGLFHLTAGQLAQVIVAYEPVWAIGTGVTASSAQAQEMHAFIRKQFSMQYDAAVADTISILYGGSVKPDNARELFSQPDIDGGLIGGAALKSRDFIDIVKAYN